MSNINVFLREHFVDISTKRIYFAPNIEEKKLNNEIGAFDCPGKPAISLRFSTTPCSAAPKKACCTQARRSQSTADGQGTGIIGFLLRGNMVARVRFGFISLTETKVLIAAGSLDHDAIDEYLDAEYVRLLRA